MKIAYMGSPKFAAAVLQGLIQNKRHEIVCVVTQPDAPCGRGQQVRYNPVKELALQYGIPVLQPAKISADVTLLTKYHPEIIVTCAFGQILKQNILEAAPHGVINVHGSLLPAYRGAAPVQWAIINGETVTGITIAQTELGLDCGPIIEVQKINIGATETAGELFARLPEVAITALLNALARIASGTAVFTPQDPTRVSLAPMLHKEMARLDWQLPAAKLVNLVRGLNPWPIAYLMLDDLAVKVYRATRVSGTGQPGQILCCDAKNGFVVACGEDALRLDEVQLPGKKVIKGGEFANAHHLLGQKLD